ncbi:P-loop containing nucleoside triphosphate hydrolase protein [Syncephalis plumigaleata]|nr:P-loop containing nucleoside triphosphate hydrolase protein [Syncephalis plumigaleata]
MSSTTPPRKRSASDLEAASETVVSVRPQGSKRGRPGRPRSSGLNKQHDVPSSSSSSLKDQSAAGPKRTISEKRSKKDANTSKASVKPAATTSKQKNISDATPVKLTKKSTKKSLTVDKVEDTTTTTTVAAKNESSNPASSPVKRRGRPPKVKPSADGALVIRRPVGRPRKHPIKSTSSGNDTSSEKIVDQPSHQHTVSVDVAVPKKKRARTTSVIAPSSSTAHDTSNVSIRKRDHVNDNTTKLTGGNSRRKSTPAVAKKLPPSFDVGKAIATITATNTGHPARDHAILERRTLLTDTIKRYDRQLRELFHLETKRNMFLYNESELLNHPSGDLQLFMDAHSLEPLLSADAVRAASASGQRTMTRHALRLFDESWHICFLLNSTTISTNMNGHHGNASMNNDISIDTSSLARSEAKVRIAPAYGSLEAFLESADRITDLSTPLPRTIFPVVPGPDESHRSMLLSHIKPRIKAIRWQRQRHSHLRGLICRSIERHFEEKRSREERERQGEEKRRRQLARQTATLIRKYWKTFEQVVEDKHKIEEMERERERGQQHLNRILEHSSRILAGRPSSVSSIDSDSMMSYSVDATANELDDEGDDDETTSIASYEEMNSSMELINDNDEDDEDVTLDTLLFENEEDEDKASILNEQSNNTVTDHHSRRVVDEQLSLDTTITTDVAIDSPTSSSPSISTSNGSSVHYHSPPISNSNTTITEQPFLLRHKLRSYQLDGLRWLVGLHNKAGYQADWGPHLIVVPTSVLLNWTKWCPGLKVVTYYGSTKERKEKRRGWSAENAFHICITTYQLVIQDQAIFRRRRWGYLVLDEAHNIKNFRSQRWQTLLGFRTQHRLLLTGTPLQNNLTELWSLLYFLMPDGVIPSEELGFASQREFHEWFGRPIDQIIESIGQPTSERTLQMTEIVHKLHTLLRPYLLRRVKADVEQQLPGKYEHTVWCRLAKRQRQLYDDFMARARTRETLVSGNYMSIINCLMQLRKVCNHPDLFEPRPVTTPFPMSDVIPEREVACIHRVERWQRLWSYHCWPGLSEREWRDQDRVGTRATSRLVASLHTPSLPLRQHEQDSFTSLLQHHLYTTERTVCDRVAHWRQLHRLNEQRCFILSHEFTRQFTHDLVQSVNDRLVQYQDIHHSGPTTTVRADRLIEEILPRNDTTDSVYDEARISRVVDPFYTIRARQRIGFPDKRLLQYDCGKLQMLAQLLRQLKENGHRTLIFTQMTRMLDILEAFLNLHGYRYLRLDGATKVDQRQLMTERFNADDRIFAFILSTRSGGIGINLTGADSVIFYDSDWNPFMDKQCQDRCHRIGQTRDVHIYRLVSEHTIESNILRKANQKRLLDNVVIQEGDFTTDFFSRVGWRDALGLNDNDDDDTDLPSNESLLTTQLPEDLDGALAQVEDADDVAALKQARKEATEVDLADRADYKGQTTDNNRTMTMTPTQQLSTASTVSASTSSEQDNEPGDIEEYMLRQAEWNYRLLGQLTD